MTIKTEKIKELIENIKQEQREQELTSLGKIEDWEERFIEKVKLLKEVEEKLEKTESAKKRNEMLISEGFFNLLEKAEEKIKVLEENNNNAIKEQYEKEIAELRFELQGSRNYAGVLSMKWSETRDENKKLEKELEEREIFIEESIKRAERGEEDAAIHFEALTDTSKKWNENKLSHWVQVFLRVKNWTIEYKKNLYNAKTKVLEKQISDKASELNEKEALLDETSGKFAEAKEIIRQLKKELEVKSELLDNVNEELKNVKKDLKDEKSKTKKLEEKVDLIIKLFTKNLPSLPKKSSNKIKALKTKMKTKSQQLIEKVKQQGQELVTKIEVRTN